MERERENDDELRVFIARICRRRCVFVERNHGRTSTIVTRTFQSNRYVIVFDCRFEINIHCCKHRFERDICPRLFELITVRNDD